MSIWDHIEQHTPDAERLAAAHEEWRKPPRNLVEQKPKGGTTLDYVGHAALTEILLRIDPLWRWSFVARDANGSPIIDRDANDKPIGMWLELHLLGMSRYGYGSVDPSSRQSDGDRIKELIGDGLRNAAMRFGIALDLWSKSDLSATVMGGRGDAPVASSPEVPSASGSTGVSPTASDADFAAMMKALKALDAEDKKGLLNNLAVLEDHDLGPKPSLKMVTKLLIDNRVDPSDPVTSSAQLAMSKIQNDEKYAQAKMDEANAS